MLHTEGRGLNLKKTVRESKAKSSSVTCVNRAASIRKEDPEEFLNEEKEVARGQRKRRGRLVEDTIREHWRECS